jgi:hypothetical protein
VLDSLFKKSFRRGRLRQAAILNLIEQETSLLPQTMEVLQTRRNNEAYDKAAYNLDLNVALLRRLFAEDDPSIDEIVAESKLIGQRMRDTGVTGSSRTKREVKQKHTKCPGPECRGFIIGQSSCALCSMRVCKDCNAALATPEDVSEHICSADDIATWTAIKATTKPCPTCGTGIEKISGCNQMWCTMPECLTAFDWASGQKINGPIHNPHYHDWLRVGGQAAVGHLEANVACDPHANVFNHRRTQDIYEALGHSVGRSYEGAYNTAFQFLRALPEATDLRRARDTVYTPDMYQEMRIEYLEKRLTKEQWATRLSHRETLRIKQERLNALLNMFAAASSDLFLRFHTDLMALCGASPPKKTLHGSLAVPIVGAFVRGCESLRVYFCTELAHCISDYANRTVRGLTWVRQQQGMVLLWSIIDVKDLENQHQPWIDDILRTVIE